MSTLRIEAVATLARVWGQTGPVAVELIDRHNVPEDYADAEALLHEVAHAAVFGMKNIKKNISERVATRFSKFKSRRAEDRSECSALAVELTILRMMRWHSKFPFGELILMAHDDMQLLSLPTVYRTIDEYLGKKITRTRAERAIKILEKLTHTS